VTASAEAGRRLDRRPLRVVDIINLSSSADTLLRERALALRAKGVDNRIICINGSYVHALRVAGIPVYTSRIPRGMHPFMLVWSLVEIWSHLRRIQPDIVHTHCSVPGIVGRLAARLAGVPVVIHTVHGFAFHERSRGLMHSLAIAVERFAGRLTDLMLCQNREDMAQAVRYGIVARERLQWIGNGIAVDRFPPAPPRPGGGRPVVICCVARFEPVKNHMLLLEAARILRDRSLRFELWLVGGGRERARCEAQCAAWDLHSRVRFLGYRDDVPALLAQADIGALTSLKEGIPRAAIEAMAAGLPFVATRVTGTKEVVRDGDTGFLVEPGDPSALADAFERLARDPALRARMGARGREVALAEFDEADIVTNLEHVYRDRLGTHGAAAAASPAREVQA